MPWRSRPTPSTSRPASARPVMIPRPAAVLAAIAADPQLTARQRTALKEVYEAFVAASPRRTRTASTGKDK